MYFGNFLFSASNNRVVAVYMLGYGSRIESYLTSLGFQYPYRSGKCADGCLIPVLSIIGDDEVHNILLKQLGLFRISYGYPVNNIGRFYMYIPEVDTNTYDYRKNKRSGKGTGKGSYH